jgi:putative IMPACT (imprinted ancient) family translation regulator
MNSEDNTPDTVAARKMPDATSPQSRDGSAPLDPLGVALAGVAAALELQPATATASPSPGFHAATGLDWNRYPPDGTDASLEQLLQRLASEFQASVFLAQVSATGSASRIQSTDKVWTAMRKKPLWLKSMLTEAAQASRPLGSSPACGMMTAVMLQANHQLGAKQVLGIGLKPGTGLPKYGLVFAHDAAVADAQAEASVARLVQVAPALTAWLACWYRNLLGRHWLQARARVLGVFRANPKVLACAALGAGLLLALPLPYWPKRECVLEPAVRQFVASPVSGRLLNAYVRPGETVRRGQLLASIDDEALRWDLSAAQADYEAAAKKRDTALATKAAGSVRVAQLELEQINVRIESLKGQLERLQVISPIDGVILQGEWFRSPGAPVSRGDSLFEVAPLERMTVEAHLRTEDLGQIHPGDRVSVHVDAAPHSVWTGEIARIDPRAKIVEDKVVFVAEVEIADEAAVLRPGMKGSATIGAGTRSIGWLLFSRPYYWLMKKILW